MKCSSGMVAMLVSGVFITVASCASNAADFAGKNVDMVIPFAVGGGSDVWGRYNAQFLGKYLPG